MVHDPIGDMIIQIKNAGMAGKRVVVLPYSRLKHEVAKLLVSERYLESVEKVGEDPKMNMKIKLRYIGGSSAVTDVKRISKPGLRLYVNHMMIPSVMGGMGVAILSTSKGIMTGTYAMKEKIGGEILCEVW